VEKHLRMARARAGAGVRGGFIQNRQLPESAPGVAPQMAQVPPGANRPGT